MAQAGKDEPAPATAAKRPPSTHRSGADPRVQAAAQARAEVERSAAAAGRSVQEAIRRAAAATGAALAEVEKAMQAAHQPSGTGQDPDGAAEDR